MSDYRTPKLVEGVKATSVSPGSSVLILVENLSVPFDRRVWQEARSLTRAGYDVVVICPQGKGRDEERFAVIDGVEIHRYPLQPASGGVRGYAHEYLMALYHTRRLVRRLSRSRDFALVHACNPPDFLLLAALSLRRSGAAFIFDQHDLVPELYLSRFGHLHGLGYKATLLAEKLMFFLSDVVISTNESYRRIALGRGRKSPKDVFVVRSAPDTTDFRRVEAKPSLKRNKPNLVAYVGVMGPQDGVDHALRALKLLRQRRDDWHAIFVGAGDVFAEMQEYRMRLGLSDCVEFTGRVTNESLIEVLSTADVCLAPDPRNPLNDVSSMNKIVEYMAIGCAIVSYDLIEARASAGAAAVYVTPNDEAALAAAIDRLFDDPTSRRRMAGVGKRRTAGELSWERSELALLTAYERALVVRRDRVGLGSTDRRDGNGRIASRPLRFRSRALSGNPPSRH